MAHHLTQHGTLAKISERVRFARRRFGHYEVIDFVVVLFGHAISGERTLEAFYESAQPFAAPFMALFGRERFPHRSTLSRFLAALNQAPVETLRTMFLEDLVARPLEKGEKREGCRTGKEHSGLCSMWMAHGKLPVNVPYHPRLISHQHAAAWMRSVLQATSGASGVRLSGPGRPCSRPIRTNGSARFRGHREQATAIIGESCGRRSRRSAHICMRNQFH